jgi:hypothetical protein
MQRQEEEEKLRALGAWPISLVVVVVVATIFDVVDVAVVVIDVDVPKLMQPPVV